MKHFLFLVLAFFYWNTSFAQSCLNVSLSNINDVYCTGDFGTANASSTDGTPPYTFLWSNGETTSTATQLYISTNFVTVTDIFGCTGTASVEVMDYTFWIDIYGYLSMYNCGDSCGMNLIVTDNYGAGGATYLWEDGSTGQSRTGLCPGTYCVTVVDYNGCTVVGCENLPAPSPPMSLTISSTNASCNTADGTATVSCNGTPPFWYSWSNGETSSSIINQPPGTYTVEVTDYDGCTATASVTILETKTLASTYLINNNVSCLGGNDGEATVLATGGDLPYSYQWSVSAGSQTTATATDLYAGIHCVTVTDNSGCPDVTCLTLAEPTLISTAINAVPANCDSTDGSATATPDTSILSPTYLWNNGQTTATATGLGQNWYSVTVTDQSNGCGVHGNIYVDEDISCKIKIHGYLYNDDNADCAVDVATTSILNRAVYLKQAGTIVDITFTDSTGYYDFVQDDGNYDIEITPEVTETLLCPSTNSVAISTTNGNIYQQDFYVEYNPIEDLSIFLSKGPARPGFVQQFWLYVCNDGATPTSGNYTITHDSLLTNFNANGTEDSYDPMTYNANWSFTNLAPGQCFTQYYTLKVPVGTPLGTILTTEGSVTPVANDLTPYNNDITCHTTVTGSYDPNNKQNFAGRNSFGVEVRE